jgi:hypothetical protein
VSDSSSLKAKNPQQTPVYSEIYGSSRKAVAAASVFGFAAPYLAATKEIFVRIPGSEHSVNSINMQ